MFEESPRRHPWPVMTALALAALGAGIGLVRTSPPAAARAPEGTIAIAAKGGRPVPFRKPSDEDLRKSLSRQQYEVTQRAGTEAPFHNEYWDHHAEGLYVDVVSGEPLFSSRDKFDSGTGWPSFSRPVAPESLATATDYKIGLPRTEVRSRQADSHLGHVFEDGPAPTGLRYCINSAALRFVPVDRLEAEGYGEFAKLFERSGSPRP